MASAIQASPTDAQLRARYADLKREHARLVARIERRGRYDLATFRLGSFTPALPALATVLEQRIEASNGRFAQLERSITGRLVPVEPMSGTARPDLRSLVLAQSARLIRERQHASEIWFRDTGSGAIVSLRLERNLEAGRPVVLASTQDITDHLRRDHELVRSREAVLHRERLRVLGELAASIAHDLGNTLRGASFELTALRQDSLPDQKRADALKAVAQRIEIASEAIARLHDFARTGTLALSAVRLDRIVAQAAALVEVDFQNSAVPVNIRMSIADLPAVRGSVSELSLLFVNLLRNGRDAMPKGGTVTIAARQERKSVVVTVADEGRGISPEVRRRLFEPYFSTKGSRGIGLGLWLAAGTMERLGGSIQAMNRPRRGTLFVLKFPIDRPRVATAGPR
jgi:signal transduction histidine kinase